MQINVFGLKKKNIFQSIYVPFISPSVYKPIQNSLRSFHPP